MKIFVYFLYLLLLLLHDDNNNKNSLFNTHKKELCTVLHLKGIKTKFVS